MGRCRLVAESPAVPVALVRDAGPDQAHNLIDWVRLVEILASPEEALALLDTELPDAESDAN